MIHSLLITRDAETLYAVQAEWDVLSYSLVRSVEPADLVGSSAVLISSRAGTAIATSVPSANYAELAVALCEARDRADALLPQEEV